MKMQMIPAIINDTGDCCCQCPPNGQDGWCHCNDNYDGKGNDIENAITCDLVWAELQPNGQKKYFKVVSGSAQQNMPVVLPTATLKKRGVVQLTNDLSNREDIALTPKGANQFKATLDKETADRIAKDTDLQNQINKEKTDRASADTDLLNKINQEKADRTGADKTLSDRITQETADRKKADSDLSNRITSAESKADSAVSKANKAVTDVTSNGDATVTVTKADGTSKSFTINNVAHASSADSATKATTADTATNANHATSADSATKADHATVADRLADGSSGGGVLIYKKYNISYQGVVSGRSEISHKEQLVGGSSPQWKWTYDYIIDLKIPLNKTFGSASNLIYVSDEVVGDLTSYEDRSCALNNDKSSVTVTMRNKSAYTYTGSNENPPGVGYVTVNYKGVVAIHDVQIKIVD